MKRRTWRILLCGLVAVMLPVASAAAEPVTVQPAIAAADPQPGAVSVPGSFDSEVGCPGDWQPDCPQVQMAQRSNDGVWSVTLALPAGSYEYKAALNNSFDVNYGKGAVAGGPNIPITVPAGGKSVTFYYNNATHWVTDDVNSPIVTAAGSFQSELGCPADWSPDCLRSWLEDPDGDGIYTLTTTAIPAGSYEVKAAVGLSWDVNYGAGGVPGGANIAFTVTSADEAVLFRFDAASHVLTVLTGGAAVADIGTPTAFWLSTRDIAWALGSSAADRTYRLYYAADGGLTVTSDGITGGSYLPLHYQPGGLPASLQAKFPAQAGLGDLRLSAKYRALLPQILTGQVAVAAFDSSGSLVDGAGLQIPGVLDDLYRGAGQRLLGVTWSSGAPSLNLWAPTAKSVSVSVYPDETSATPVATTALSPSGDGVWSVTGPSSWKGDYYLFDVTVYVPETGAVEHNVVTDPYSVGLSRNSTRSLLVDLTDPALKPAGWAHLAKPALPKPEDQSITELHIRDFSIGDPTVPAGDRGTYQAFTDTTSNAVQHLAALARAGLTTVHLLPSNDIATSSINEDKSTWQTPPCDLPALPPDSDQQQQACVMSVANTDGYNWGYDPLHYTTPEGSYATDPHGAARTLQFRNMVKALNKLHLRVVMDVVYNHTSDAGQSGANDLDRIVPGYYHRLNAVGAVYTNSCCPDTATEHMMMGKLVVDSVTTWAKQYKVDGFRFDLMGFQPKANILAVRAALNKLTVAHDGVDGKQIYLYGEGWDFGEVANDALFVNATQANMAGTGIGTFNDRLRDAVRGGGPFDTDPRIQGFGSGEYTDPNGDPINGSSDTQKAALLHNEDLIKVGLAGNLKAYQLVDAAGDTVTGSQIDYNGSPAGYTSDPQEAINYVDAHDGQTLYDTLTLKLPQPTTMADRIRMQTLSLATTALSQGVSFWQAGTENLRSKSFDSNSYNSGDWFNILDPSLQTNGFARGLPPAASNQAMWPYEKPLLADPALNPTPADIQSALAQSETLLSLRQSSPLFHLGTAQAIEQKLSFPNSGPDSTPGVITMRIDDTVGPNIDPALKGIVVVFNATPSTTTQTVSAAARSNYALSPIQQHGSDPVVRASTYDPSTGTFTVPGRTVAVFINR